MSRPVTLPLLILYGTVGWVGLQVACDDEVRGYPPEVDNDSDDPENWENDTDSECSQIAWGTKYEIGQPVANWTQIGFIDSDRDGQVEWNEVRFSLQDIHCSGLSSIVFVQGDET